MREDLMLNVANFEATEENYDSLREAVQRLSSASEAQFESIKKEKWYNRVFDMVTFSQKGKKRLAEQIGTVAQAQQVLVELLLRLSANDSKVSELVLQNKSCIERIQEQNIYLLSRIKHLENVALGIKKDTDINGLSDENRELLCATIYYINQKYGDSSDEQKAFANAVLKYLGVADVQMDNPFTKLGNLNNDSKRKILACCMEYMFLKDCTEECIDEYEDVLDEFDFGRKTLKEISRQIKAIYNLRGVEGFYSKYQDDTFEDFEDSFYADFLENAEIEEEFEEVDEESVELEEYYINSMFHVGSGETKRFDNKEIHIKSFINCEGTLEFHNCVIYYNESDISDEITIGEDARIGLWNCIVICKGYDKKPFISGRDIKCLWLEKTTFIDCTHFAKISNGCIKILNCKLINCVAGFIDFTMDKQSTFDMLENVIIEQGQAKYIKPLDFKEGIPSMIKTYYTGFEDSEEHRCEVFDNLFLVDGKGAISFKDRYHLEGNNMLVYKCTFKGISNNIKTFQVEDCEFIGCKNVIHASVCGMEEYGTLIANCLFENCTNIISLGDMTNGYTTKIRNSQFISCYDKIVHPTWYGDSFEMEFCEFINVSSGKNGKHMDGSCIEFTEGKNRIKKCVFNGVELRNGFLIGGKSLKKPTGIYTYIEECNFMNCTTKANTGKIIDEYVVYDTLLAKKQRASVIAINGCRGLDKINKGEASITTANYSRKTSNDEGERIGATITAEDTVGAPETLVDSLEEIVETSDVLFQMQVEDVFEIKDRGIVAVGTIDVGKIKVGDTVVLKFISGGEKEVVVRGIEMQRKLVDMGFCGDSVGILLHAVMKSEIQRGDYLVKTAK